MKVKRRRLLRCTRRTDSDFGIGGMGCILLERVAETVETDRVVARPSPAAIEPRWRAQATFLANR